MTAFNSTPIAILGISCRFPGSDTAAEFWNLLQTGQHAIRDIPSTRWPVEAYYDPHKTNGKMYVRQAGFIDDIDLFDPSFFGISPREAIHLDPQQRLVLENIWHALEDAGINPLHLANSATGVFVGQCNADYLRLHCRGTVERFDAYSGTGLSPAITANRVSYFLNLHGPSITIDTACSSSLVALHMACQSLRLGESSLGLVAGVNLMLAPDASIVFSHANMLAPDARCKTFDAKADGYVRGEGCGVVVLKRLSDAQRDGDNVLAILRGSAVNQDGLTNGLTAPNGPAQQAVIRAALANAGISANQISYLEAHGTGTKLGDPIEVNAAKAVLLEARSNDNPCYLGSVKTNIGHLEAAAGIAGLIKVVLALKHQAIPAHLHLTEMNPLIRLSGTPLIIPTGLTPWPDDHQPRIAGVSSFGFGGTNAHVIVQEAPAGQTVHQAVQSIRPIQLLPVSAKSERALRTLVQHYSEHETSDLAGLCASAQTGRAHLPRRLALIASTHSDLQHQLNLLANQTTPLGEITSPPAVAFLFTGQGSQYIGMGRQLYETEPVFRETMEQCAELLKPHLPQPLLSVLYPAKGDASTDDLINQTTYTQPALFALEVALARLWQSWGIQPQVVLGHSVGEVAAVHIAGVLSLEEALMLIAARARLMQALPGGGGMIAVSASLTTVNACLSQINLDKAIAIAADNAPENVVLSGELTALQTMAQHLQTQGIHHQWLTVSHAFHSPLMQPMLAAFKEVVSGLHFQRATIPVIANSTGCIAGNEISTADYWAQHVINRVQFRNSVKTLFAITPQPKVILEIGPKATLLGLTRMTFAHTPKTQPTPVCFLPSLNPDADNVHTMTHALAKLYTAGAHIDWLKYCGGIRPHVLLPLYPFERQRYWLESSAQPEQAPGAIQTDVVSSNTLSSSLSSASGREALSPLASQPLLSESIDPVQTTLPDFNALSADELEQAFITLVRESVASTLNIAPAQLDIHQALQRLGMDSLMAVELRNHVAKTLNISLPIALLMEGVTVVKVADYLRQQWVLQQHPSSPKTDAAPGWIEGEL